MTDAIGIIQREHTALVGVVDCLNHAVQDIGKEATPEQDALIDAILDYIESFPDRFHHPKEDEYLFKALYNRAPEARATLDVLMAEHVTGAERIAEVRRTREAFRTDAAGRDAFVAAVRAYVDFQYEHMAREETEILPLAREALTPGDWARINAAFSDHDDPLFGDRPAERFRDLHRRITSLAPPPIGLGGGQSSIGDRPGLKERLIALLGGARG
ncbi:MAG: hemerythrin domain-containing protein [Alphaproteobacteria bacterium]|nr:hemerythrin domain-containing protein [Alphaproteobacteria bacterium]